MRPIVLTLLLAACVAPTAQTPREEVTTLMLLGGSSDKLAAYEAAARACGFRGWERIPNGEGGEWIRVVGPLSWITGNKPKGLECADQYYLDHPEGLYLIGNKARED